MGHEISAGHGTEGCEGGTDEYPTGTESYPAGTEGYASAPGGLVPDAQRDGDGSSDDEVELPWWKRYGCDQYEPFWEDVRNGIIPIETNDPRARPRSRAAEVLDGDEDAGWLPRESHRPPRRPPVTDPPDRQVNVKLRPADFETLQMVAADYGVATSTMARMLLQRGIRAAAPNPR